MLVVIIVHFVEITEKGRLYGYFFLGTIIVKEHINKIDRFPEQLENLILHGILSHHGNLENGSTVLQTQQNR